MLGGEVMRIRKKLLLIMLLIIITLITVVIFVSCGRDHENGVDGSQADNGSLTEEEQGEEAIDSDEDLIDADEEEAAAGNGDEPEQEDPTEEEEIEGNDEEISEEILELIEDQNQWMRFEEEVFESIIGVRRYTNSSLSYEDFNEGIDYYLMMVEEQVIEVFGPPERSVEDPFVFQMHTLEYDGLQVHINDYEHGLYATGFYLQSPAIPGPRGTAVGQSVGEVLTAFPLPGIGNYSREEGQVIWGEETMFYSAHMAVISHLPDGTITEVRYAENNGFAGIVYQIDQGLVNSIYFFEMN